MKFSTKVLDSKSSPFCSNICRVFRTEADRRACRNACRQCCRKKRKGRDVVEKRKPDCGCGCRG